MQISWLGYCNDTHIDEIDYIIADENVVKEKNYNHNSKIIKMPIYMEFSFKAGRC